MLEAGHKLSMEEMTTTKLSDAEGLEMDRETGLGWGPSPGAVVVHVRQYEVVIKVRVDGDMAKVQFIFYMDWADKFRGNGGATVG